MPEHVSGGDAFEATDFRLHEGRGLAVVEKWYVDALLPHPEPALLVVYLVSLRISWLPPLAWTTVELLDADGSPHHDGRTARRVRGGPGWLDFGAVSIVGNRVRWSLEGLAGDLEMRPRHPPAILSDPIFRDEHQLVRWWVEVPDAEVCGRLWWPGGGREVVAARGYRDRVYANAKPWRFPLRRLRWGHAAAGAFATVWFEAETSQQIVRAGWQDGRVNGVLPPLPVLRNSRLVLQERLGERLAGRARWLRPALRYMTSDPCQLRWTAEARLQGECGQAAYEEVRWGSSRSSFAA